jgi:tRNA pseudouridine55 synthase
LNGLHGYLVVDKPAGWTSHDVVGRLRRLLNERRIGHAGTLDPAATGVLPVAVGTATKTLEYLDGASKTYLAEIGFGIETDSYDADGVVTRLRDATGVRREDVEQALAKMRGPQLQVPPMHSAIKIGGRRLYEAARRGETVERPPRPVEFFALELIEWRAPVATVLVDCSKGTYVRSLAHDLGRAIGPGAHLADLVRLRSGPFTLCQAWTIGELSALVGEVGDDLGAVWPRVALHPDAALWAWPALVLDERGRRSLLTGRTVGDVPDGERLDGFRARAYDAEGTWLGVVEWESADAAWRPVKMMT